MAYAESITLVSYLKAVPDTRHARGKQYELWVLLTILSAALLSGQKTVWGIVEWALEHASELIAIRRQFAQYRRQIVGQTFESNDAIGFIENRQNAVVGMQIDPRV